MVYYPPVTCFAEVSPGKLFWMAFRALLVSQNVETNSAMTAACRNAGILVDACSDIFTAIEKGKSRAFSCVIADWADQPEASFLLKRARESAQNRNTVAIALVDHEPTSAEMQDNRLDFLIYRPIADEEATAVLVKASEKMQPLGSADAAVAESDNHVSSQNSSAVSDKSGATEPSHQEQSESYAEGAGADEAASDDGEVGKSHRAFGIREACAAVLLLAAVFFVWRASGVIQYLARTPEGGMRVLRESVAALFYSNQTGALPISSAGSAAQQDAYFSRGPAPTDASAPTIGVAATESTIADTRTPLPKASDFPLPAPAYEAPAPVPVHVQRAAIPESMRNSPPIERPTVVTVNPAQMMSVSAPQSPQLGQNLTQATNEPVTMSEDAARARLVHSVDPVYPPEALPQKLHGPVVLQAVIAPDGSVEDLKIVRGYFILGRAAIAAVKQWRFQPYSSGGRAASTQTVITVNFNSPS